MKCAAMILAVTLTAAAQAQQCDPPRQGYTEEVRYEENREIRLRQRSGVWWNPFTWERLQRTREVEGGAAFSERLRQQQLYQDNWVRREALRQNGGNQQVMSATLGLDMQQRWEFGKPEVNWSELREIAGLLDARQRLLNGHRSQLRQQALQAIERGDLSAAAGCDDLCAPREPSTAPLRQRLLDAERELIVPMAIPAYLRIDLDRQASLINIQGVQQPSAIPRDPLRRPKQKRLPCVKCNRVECGCDD